MKNSTENVLFRAIVALSVICILFGSALYFLGSSGAESSWTLWNEEVKKADSPQFKECFDRAIKNGDNNSIENCYTLHSSNVELLRHWSEQAKSAQRTEYIGLLLIVLPVPLFLLFYIFRWVIVGRWRSKADGRTSS